MVSNPVPDARRAGPGIAWKERRTAPRYAAVWVRVGGQWRRGRIIEWVRQIDRDGWDCVIMADEPMSGPPWQGRYAFDPRSTRARDTDEPPAESNCQDLWIGHFTQWFGGLEPGVRQSRSSGMAALVSPFWFWVVPLAQFHSTGSTAICRTGTLPSQTGGATGRRPGSRVKSAARAISACIRASGAPRQ